MGGRYDLSDSSHLRPQRERVDGGLAAMYKLDVGRQRYRRVRGLRIDAEESHTILSRGGRALERGPGNESRRKNRCTI